MHQLMVVIQKKHGQLALAGKNNYKKFNPRNDLVVIRKILNDGTMGISMAITIL
jgi:hypothetical protein